MITFHNLSAQLPSLIVSLLYLYLSLSLQMDFVCELLGVRDPGMLNRGIRPYDKRKLETALKGVNVEVTHRKSNRQVPLIFLHNHFSLNN